MKVDEIDTLLSKLTQATGVGYHGNIAQVVVDELHSFGIQATVGHDRSVIGELVNNKTPRVMLACHIDEIGFLVSGIDEAGRLRMSPIGGADPRILPGQEVVVHGRETLRGYIGAKPPHLLTEDERKKVIPVEDLFVDTGLPGESVRQQVTLGDYITFASDYQKLAGHMRRAKSLDNRVSVACGLLVMRELTQSVPPCDVYFVATSQEEFSGLGARIHSYRLPVDHAIVVDVTHGEHPALKEHEYFPLGKGPTIARGATVPEKLFSLMEEAAQEIDIQYQIEAFPRYSGTDAETIAFNREGIATCVLGIPLRYMHTPVEIASLKDVEQTARLIIHFLKRLADNSHSA